MELHQAIVNMENGGSADGILQVHLLITTMSQCRFPLILSNNIAFAASIGAS